MERAGGGGGRDDDMIMSCQRLFHDKEYHSQQSCRSLCFDRTGQYLYSGSADGRGKKEERSKEKNGEERRREKKFQKKKFLKILTFLSLSLSIWLSILS